VWSLLDGRRSELNRARPNAFLAKRFELFGQSSGRRCFVMLSRCASSELSLRGNLHYHPIARVPIDRSPCASSEFSLRGNLRYRIIARGPFARSHGGQQPSPCTRCIHLRGVHSPRQQLVQLSASQQQKQRPCLLLQRARTAPPSTKSAATYCALLFIYRYSRFSR
jgi:hypothetical protein